MRESDDSYETIQLLPPLLEVPQQWLTRVTYNQISMNTPIMMGAYGASAEATCNHAELLQQLHSDKQRLEEELERALMRPLHDESEDRINISHKIWLIQQSELKRLDDYKIRFYVAVFALILILAKLLIAFH